MQTVWVFNAGQSATGDDNAKVVGEVINDGTQTVANVNVTLCAGGQPLPSVQIPGTLQPGERAPFRFSDPSWNATTRFDVVASGTPSTPDVLVPAPPTIKVGNLQFHPADQDHGGFIWLTCALTNPGPGGATNVQIAATVYDPRGQILDAFPPTSAGGLSLEPRQTVSIAITLEGLTALPDNAQIAIRAVGAPATGPQTAPAISPIEPSGPIISGTATS